MSTIYKEGLDLEANLTLQQVQDFLKPTGEYKAVGEEFMNIPHIRLSLETFNGTYNTLIYRCTVMTLIRHLQSLSYRYGAGQEPDIDKDGNPYGSNA